MDMDDSRPRSVFVVLFRPDHRAPHFCSILQFQSKQNKHDESSASQQFDVKEVAHFANPRLHARWLFSLLSNEELFMVPYIDHESCADLPSFNGIAFNLRTKTLRTTNPPFSFKPCVVGCAVNHGGSIYFMPHPCDQRMSPDRLSPDNRFERFVPASDKWETLQPFPLPSNTIIQATAVLKDTILFNMLGCEIWAYNVPHNKWYSVTVEDRDKLCYSIEGEAVVRGNTILALKDNHHYSFPYNSVPYNSVLALSIQRETMYGEIAYTCSLLCVISVPDMTRISSMCGGSASMETRNLVHLGQDDFCLVQSCRCAANYQPILLTYMTLKGNDLMIVTGSCFHKLPIGAKEQFFVAFCFSLPEFKTPPTSQQAQKFFDINPIPEGSDREHYPNLRKTALGIPSAKQPPFKVQDYLSSQTSIFDGEELSLDPTVKALLSLYPALKAELLHHPVLEACYASAGRNPSHGYAKPPFAQKESTLGDGCHASKRLKTVGEDFEQGGGSKTRDPSAYTSTPKIHKHEKSSASERRLTTVPEGGLIYHGRPLFSYTFPEQIIIVHSLKHARSRSRSRSRATRS